MNFVGFVEDFYYFLFYDWKIMYVELRDFLRERFVNDN